MSKESSQIESILILKQCNTICNTKNKSAVNTALLQWTWRESNWFKPLFNKSVFYRLFPETCQPQWNLLFLYEAFRKRMYVFIIKNSVMQHEMQHEPVSGNFSANIDARTNAVAGDKLHVCIKRNDNTSTDIQWLVVGY